MLFDANIFRAKGLLVDRRKRCFPFQGN